MTYEYEQRKDVSAAPTDASNKLYETAMIGGGSFDSFGSAKQKKEQSPEPGYNDVYSGMKGLTHAAVAQQTSFAKSVEQPHNYVGAVVDIWNGMINEVVNNTGQLLATFGESAVAGYVFRCAPVPIRGAMLAGGAVLGACELATHAPGWIDHASMVINDSSYTAQEQARAHAGLENIGGGIVELGAGFKGFGLGMYAPEAYGALRGGVSAYRAGSLTSTFSPEVLEALPGGGAGPLTTRNLLGAMKNQFAIDAHALDWAATPAWITKTSDAFQSKIEGMRSRFKPDAVAAENPHDIQPARPTAEASALRLRDDDLTPTEKAAVRIAAEGRSLTGIQEALVSATKEIDRLPDSVQKAELYSSRAYAHSYLGHNELALRDISTAIEMNAKNGGDEEWHMFALRGRVKENLGDADGGKADYFKALELSPAAALFPPWPV